VNRPLILGCAAVLTVLLAGCGSSSSSTTPSASVPAAASPTTASAQTTPASNASALTVTTKHSKLGTILAAGPKKLTVYLFEADKGSQSACSGACAKVWPPVTTSAAAEAGGAADAADLGTVMRSDGKSQVTYKGRPLYFYDDDKDAGDAYGQGSKSFGAGWYVLKPSGAKIDSDNNNDNKKGGDDDEAS
jgi:predicted lipoprotein with Yx(FWY)xxD motif